MTSESLDLRFLADEFERVYTRVRELPVTPTAGVLEVRHAVEAAFDLERGAPLEAVARRAATLLREYTLQVVHPRYFGLFNPSVHPSGVLADAMVALFNPQVAGWSHAPAANEMERLALRRLATALGYDPETSAAHFTSGGNEANHTAVVAALARRYPAWAADGVRALTGHPAVYLSTESHHSFTKIARATGLGTYALRVIDVDEQLRMRVDLLEQAIATDRSTGRIPLAVVGTAGTTGAGAIDPLAAIADVCAREDVWFHVDAAWGGAAALVPGLRAHLRGIERADSITFDAHKWLSVPIGAGIFFTKHPDALHLAFGVETGYVPPTEEGAVDQYKFTMQWSRRFIGLKVLFLLAEHGVEGVAQLVERQAMRGEALRARLRGRDWQVVNDTPLPLVCFTRESLRRDHASTRAFVEQVLARRRVWISDVRLPGAGWVLRACITSFRTNEADLDVLMEELEATCGPA